MTARWDVQVLGLDDGKPAAAVVASVARRLGADPNQVQRLLAHAPTTLVADLDEGAARAIVQELRVMGLRVKPRPTAAETEASGPPLMTPSPMSVADERATAPTIALPIPATRASAIDPLELELGLGERPAPHAARSSPLEHLAASDLRGSSGLELEDVAPPVRARPVVQSSRPPPTAAPVASAPVPAPAPDAEAPRVFWSALPAAFLVPFRRPVLAGLIAAPFFMVAAVVCSILGTFTAIAGVLVMTAAFVGTTLQVAHRCLWATAVGERMPAGLPGDFLAEYAYPGIGVLVVQGLLGGAFSWLGLQAIAHGVPAVAVQAALVPFALYNVIGFSLAAASRSPLAFLDVTRIVRIGLRAPVEIVAIAIVGAIVQGGAIAIAATQVLAAVAAGGIGNALLAVGGSVFVVSFAAGYGSALSATMMGMLFWARPEVASG